MEKNLKLTLKKGRALIPKCSHELHKCFEVSTLPNTCMRLSTCILFFYTNFLPTFTSEHRGTRWEEAVLVRFRTAVMLSINCIDDNSYQGLNNGRHWGCVKLVLSEKRKARYKLYIACDTLYIVCDKLYSM